MNKKIGFTVIVVLLVAMTSFAQKVYTNNSYKAGENLTYTASYFMSGLWTDIAEVSMSVSPMKTKKSNLYRIKCSAKTFQKWDSFFKIRDLYESYVNPKTTQPLLFKRQIDEGGYKKKVKVLFKRKSKTAISTINRPLGTPAKKHNAKIHADTYDFVSVLYALRTADLNKLGVGQGRTFRVIADSKHKIKEEQVTVTYQGTEMVETPYGLKKCYKLAISLKNNKVLKGGKAKNKIWLTADKNRIPVKIVASIPVGSVQVRLKSWEGLKN